ncbi:MAG: acetoin utilization protein AcuC [Chitinispirillaceae bacterium]|nr:acetoin utilization protein AcuC [Chitinispirillaceae bacterium]
MPPAEYIFIYSSELEKYHYPQDCPFKTERATHTREILHKRGSFSFFNEIPPRSATLEELTLFHSEKYLNILQRASEGKIDADILFYGLGTPDCPIFKDLYPYATLATGATLVGTELLLSKKAKYCFNPSGGYHHAFAEKAGGFCYINDVVIGCKKLSSQQKRVFCLDLDAHHGNGTQDAFYNTSEVFTVSFHESGKTLFPWGGFENEIGEEEGYGYNVNVPLPPHTDDDNFLLAFKEIVLPLISVYKPDFIVLEIGMDILSVDPLTHLSMTNNVIADIIPLLKKADIPMLVLGGGGYNIEATSRGWALAWEILCGVENDYDDLSIGMGGIFLGNAEWNGGIRDMRSYLSGEEKILIGKEVSKTVEFIKKNVFPLHGI